METLANEQALARKDPMIAVAVALVVDYSVESQAPLTIHRQDTAAR